MADTSTGSLPISRPTSTNYRYLGTALEQAGDLSGALRAYRETLQIDPTHSEAQSRAASLESRVAFSPAATAEIALPSPSMARAEAPWLVGPYAAAAGTVQCPSCRRWSKPESSCECCGVPLNSAARGGLPSSSTEAPGVPGAGPYSGDRLRPAQSATARPEGLASSDRWLVDPTGQRGTRRLLGFMAVYVVAAVCLMGWLFARWLPGLLREATLPRPSPAVQALLVQAQQAVRSAHLDEAEHLSQQALEEARTLGDQPGMAFSLYWLGYVNYQRRRPQRAVEYYRQASALFHQVGDQRDEAGTLEHVGAAYAYARQPQRAVEYYRQALPLFRELRDKRGEGRTLSSIGLVYSNSRQPQRALEYFQQALPLYREAGDKRSEAGVLNNIGFAYSATRQPQRSLESHQQALTLFHQAGNKKGEARTLGSIAWVYWHTRQPQKAIEYYQPALILFRQLGDKRGEAGTLNNMGLAYSDVRQPQRALEYVRQAVALWRQVGDRKFEAETVDSLGMVYEAAGQPQRALPYYQQTLALARQIGDKQVEALEISNIARLQRRLSGQRSAVASAEMAPTRAAPLAGGRR